MLAVKAQAVTNTTVCAYVILSCFSFGVLPFQIGKLSHWNSFLGLPLSLSCCHLMSQGFFGEKWKAQSMLFEIIIVFFYLFGVFAANTHKNEPIILFQFRH